MSTFRERKEKPTIDMCFHKEAGSGNLCKHKPTWKLKGEKHKFKVCDEHLAWGIRICGLPAMVDKYDPNPEKSHFEEFNPPEVAHKDYSGNPTIVGKKIKST